MLLVRHLTDGSFGKYFTKVMECCVDFFFVTLFSKSMYLHTD